MLSRCQPLVRTIGAPDTRMKPNRHLPPSANLATETSMQTVFSRFTLPLTFSRTFPSHSTASSLSWVHTFSFRSAPGARFHSTVLDRTTAAINRFARLRYLDSYPLNERRRSG